MKKLLFLISFICVSASVGVSTALVMPRDNVENYQVSYRDQRLGEVMRFIMPNEIIMYVFDQSILEGVSPIKMIAILQIENPQHVPTAINYNIHPVWDKKTQKYVKKVVSFDKGLFQLNSMYIDEFVSKFWTPYEIEEFNVDNYKHNTRVAIRLFISLLQIFGNDEKAVCAYNCGTGNVLRNTIPKKTMEVYLPAYLRYTRRMLGE